MHPFIKSTGKIILIVGGGFLLLLFLFGYHSHSHEVPVAALNAEREENLYAIKTVVGQLNIEYGASPLSGFGDKYPPACRDESSTLYLCLKKLSEFEDEETLRELLSDPRFGENLPESDEMFSYKYSANQSGFKICAFFEGQAIRSWVEEKLPTELSEKNIKMYCKTNIKNLDNIDSMPLFQNVGVPQPETEIESFKKNAVHRFWLWMYSITS